MTSRPHGTRERPGQHRNNAVKHTDRSYNAHVALHLTFVDGLVIRHHVYEDNLSVAEAWGG